MQKPKVLITGASRGIGRSVASIFADNGYEVVAPDRSQLDLADSRSVAEFALTPAVEKIDVLINNAGENQLLPLGEIGLEDIQRMLAINVTAGFLLARRIGVDMATRGGGHIVNVSSIYSMISRERRSMYSTAKAALNGMTRALAVELGPRKVLVNSVCPGFVDTDLTRKNNSNDEIAKLCERIPLRRMAAVDEISNFIYYLGSPANTYISGQSIAIDGAFLCQ